MDKDIAVITGAGGIGLAIARRVGRGRTVLLADYNEKALSAAAELLRGEGYDVATRITDVSEPDSVAALADAAGALGRVTHVVHTAGLSPVQASAERILHVDLRGVALVLHEFARVIAAGGAGLIVSSMAGHMSDGYPSEIEHAIATTAPSELLALPFLAPDAVGNSGAAYALAKRGNAVQVLAAAVTWGQRGARINCISPGVISTPLAQDEMAGPAGDGYRAMIAASAAGRIGTPDDVADAAAYLLGPQATFVTGADLLIDGGVVAALRAGAVSLAGDISLAASTAS
jgi:NAD(P)-dependent dehydrogenase (short-subunit alcohol dehydrogenase family)